MQCRRCGKELGNSLKCTFCGYENTEGNLRNLTRIEKNFFDGETIDIGSIDGQSGKENFRDKRRYDYDFGTRRTFVNVDGGGFFSRAVSWILREWLGGNKLVKIAVTLVFVAFAALMMFVALPIIFVILAAGIIILTLISKFR